MKKFWMTVIILVSVLLLGGYVCAQPMEPGEMSADSEGPGMMANQGGSMPMGGMRSMRGDVMEIRHHIMRLMMDLGLDHKQMEAVHDIVDKTAKEMIKKRADLMVAEIDLDDILHREPLDMSAVESKLKQIEAMRTDMFMTRLKAYEEMRGVLNPEQNKKLKQMMEMRMMGEMGMEKGKRPYHEEKRMKK